MMALPARHHILLDLIGGAPVQYLDIPVHDNIGDLLIYLGTLAFLRKFRIRTTQIAADFNYSRRNDHAIILMHGGGNLGDLHPHYEIFRERVISENHDRRIVILPQSIHFESKGNFERARKIMRSHPDLHLCVRDQVSVELAQHLCKNVLLLPDMAHHLYPVVSTLPAETSSILALHRTDVEAMANVNWIPGNAHVADWFDLVGYRRGRFARRAARLTTALNWMGLRSVTTTPFAKWWEYTARTWTDEAVALFSRHARVVTDRLHAHILACLMDKPNTVFDNSYGKNSRYLAAWTGTSPLVESSFPANGDLAAPPHD